MNTALQWATDVHTSAEAERQGGPA